MTVKTINGIRVIAPVDGLWLYNESNKIISDKVFLGVNASESEWTEISEERKIELEVLWEEENNPDNEAA